jgi:thiamine-phosphate pyrophosphorylase
LKKPIDFRFIVITDRLKLRTGTLEAIVEQCCISGVRAVQLREKDLNAYELLNLAFDLRKITKKYSSYLIINDRLDIVLLSKANGLHSPRNGILSKDVKRINKKILTGTSVHSLEEAVKAEKFGFDYIMFGPIFRTASKIKYGKPQGLKKLKEVCNSVKIPVFAVGGITPPRAKRCVENGAYGVAVISAVMRAKNVKETISEFRRFLGKL